MEYFGEDWDEREFPLAYLITIRTYGTWLHGDERSSIDTHDEYNIYGAERRVSDPRLEEMMRRNMNADAFVFNDDQREAVEDAIKEVCRHRGYNLYSVNVRTNHAHVVVHGKAQPELISNSFKSYATRELKKRQLIHPDTKVWSRGRSRRYLWKPKHVEAAIDYVGYGQGYLPFEQWYVEEWNPEAET